MRRNLHFIQNVHVINGENRPIDFRGGYERNCNTATVGEYNRGIKYYQMS